MRRLLTFSAAGVAAALLFASCGGDSNDAGHESGQDQSTSAPDNTETDQPDDSALPTVVVAEPGSIGTVAEPFGERPTIVFPDIDPLPDVAVDVVSEGDGPEIRSGDQVIVDYYGAVWQAEEPFDTSFSDEREPFAVTVGTGMVIPGWDAGLVGQKEGSRFLLSIPSEYAYPEGSGEIEPGDTIVFVVDVHQVISDTSRYDAVAKDSPRDGIVVEGELGTEPGLSIKSGTAEPKDISTTLLAEGSGPKLKKGQDIYLQIKAIDWNGASGANTWGTPGALIQTNYSQLKDDPALSALLEYTVGSRVLLEIPKNAFSDPSEDGEDDAASPSPDQPAIVSVIDIVDQVKPL